jgi:hypothetical protein
MIVQSSISARQRAKFRWRTQAKRKLFYRVFVTESGLAYSLASNPLHDQVDSTAESVCNVHLLP